MRKRLFTIWALAAPALLAGAELLPIGEGQIDGKIAIAGMPVDPQTDELLPPFGARVHLVPEKDSDREISFPAGEWFQPAKGRYKVWVEGEGRMSPAPTVIHYSASPFAGRGMLLTMPVVPAGKVRLGSPPGEQQTFRLLHLDSHDRDGALTRETSRRVRGGPASEGVWMPEGRVLGGLFDDGLREYVALSRPSTVAYGSVTTVLPSPPAPGTSCLLAVLERPGHDRIASEREVTVELSAAGRALPPDVLAVTFERIYAVWYDLNPGPVSLSASSASAELAEIGVTLRRDRIESVRTSMALRPSLNVSLELPAEMIALKPVLEVRGRPRPVVLAERSASRPAEVMSFKFLHSQEVEARLSAGPWTFRQTVDLRGGTEHEVRFAPWPIHVHGRVFVGETPTPAVVRFQVGRRDDLLTAQTDEEGDYEATLYRPARYVVAIEVPDRAAVPYYERLEEPIESSGRLDFHLPDNRVRIEVVNAETSDPIPGAGVAVLSETDRPDKGFALNLVSDRAGRVALPPVFAGTLRVEVVAAGYDTMARDVEIPDQAGFTREIVFRLRREGSVGRLVLLQEDGRPAQAEVAALSWDATSLVWARTANRRGEVKIPESVEGSILLVRHPGSAFLARRFDAADEEPVIWRLPPRGPPLVLRTVDASGRPRPFVGLVLRVDGVVLPPLPLGWATGTTGASDREGLWIAENVPPAPLELGAVSADGVGPPGPPVALRPPWPVVVPIEAPH